MAEKFLLKDHLFNAETVGQLAQEYAAGVPGFDPDRFADEALAGFPERELMQRLEWMADCLERQLSADFRKMADQLEAAMPPPLDPSLRDDDFGHFIHALPGILAVRHGLEHYRERALDVLYQATQRFSMEYYIRPFLNRWPDKTLARLEIWAQDRNYHVRRLVSEGTRPKLPWAKAVKLTQDQTMPLLDVLHADQTRFVTRSVANHLNDIAKVAPDLVVARLGDWAGQGRQVRKEMDWMTGHALRTLVKQGHEGALALLGFRRDAPVAVCLDVTTPVVARGDRLRFQVTLTAAETVAVQVDYRLQFARPQGKTGEKVFKLRQGKIAPDQPLVLQKAHYLKADATTFRLYPGRHGIVVQVNGQDLAQGSFDVT